MCAMTGGGGASNTTPPTIPPTRYTCVVTDIPTTGANMKLRNKFAKV